MIQCLSSYFYVHFNLDPEMHIFLEFSNGINDNLMSTMCQGWTGNFWKCRLSSYGKKVVQGTKEERYNQEMEVG